MRPIPEFRSASDISGIRLEVARAGFTRTMKINPEEIAQLFFRAAERSTQNLNETLKAEMAEDRLAIYQALRQHPGCLVADAQLREIVGVSE